MDEEIKMIADYYGYDIQARQCCEELAELIQAICKHSRAAEGEPWYISINTPERWHIIEEMADVSIMLEQIIYLLGITDEELDNHTQRKINRQLQRIEEMEDGE